MKDFKRNNKFGGGGRGGFRGGGDRRGGGNSFGKRDFGGSQEMHSAVCAQCGKTCEVPFRPNGKKPVFCRDCFGGGKEQGQSHSFEKREFRSAPSNSFRSERPVTSDRQIEDLKRQIETLHVKLDRILKVVEVTPGTIAPVVAKEKAEGIVIPKTEVAKETKEPKQKTSKKAVAKKK